jgi:hypothetical protein
MTANRDDDEPEDEWDDGDDSDDELLIPCPYCRREIFEDSPRCPYCERSISEEDRWQSIHPQWVIATAVVCLVAILWWMLVRS